MAAREAVQEGVDHQQVAGIGSVAGSRMTVLNGILWWMSKGFLPMR
jgi:hypothetical protein